MACLNDLLFRFVLFYSILHHTDFLICPQTRVCQDFPAVLIAFDPFPLLCHHNVPLNPPPSSIPGIKESACSQGMILGRARAADCGDRPARRFCSCHLALGVPPQPALVMWCGRLLVVIWAP